MYSSYEPTIYPGVNIKYFYNNINEAGVCNCSSKCNGKGSGKGDGDCKKITIAVFNSGKIIITGGNSFDQVLISYEFINSLLSDKIKYENIITNDDIKNNNKVKDKEIKYQVKLK
jgi:TATA-box binding protein (TBP) (component of TFIID and TFIIIB)